MNQKLSCFSLLVCLLSTTSFAEELSDAETMDKIPEGAYLKLLQDLKLLPGQTTIYFFEGKIVPFGFVSQANSNSTKCILWASKTSSHVIEIPRKIDTNCACLVLNKPYNRDVYKTDQRTLIQGTMSFIKDSTNFATFHCYKERGETVTIGDMKAAIQGILELHIPPTATKTSLEKYVVPEEGREMEWISPEDNQKSGSEYHTPEKRNRSCTLL